MMSLFEFMQPHSWLPPEQPWQGASESLIAASDHPWVTPAEQSDLIETPDYASSIAWLEKLCTASPLLTMQEFGRSAEGRPLYLVIASLMESPTAEKLRQEGKMTILVQAGIHPGEIEGKDAGFMLLRDIAFGVKAELLTQVNLLFIPVLNPDGHERSSTWSRPNQRGPLKMGWRTTAQNLNLNRDYIKADAPEMRSLLKLLSAWPVHLYVDVHSTDGLDFQYDITYAYHGREGTPSWSPQINAWLDRSFSPAVDAALHSQHHLPLNLYVQPVSNSVLTLGLRETQMPPRFSLGYGDLRHIPSVLIETHSLKSYRQRVLATYVFIEAAMRHLAKDGAALKNAMADDKESRPQDVILTWASGGPKREIDFHGSDFEHYESVASGSKEVRWLGKPRLFPNLPIHTDQAGIKTRRPRAYVVPVTKPQVIERLRLHDITFETLETEQQLDVTMYRLTLPSPAQPVPAEEGRFPVPISGVTTEQHTQTFPAGSIRVPTDQPNGDLAIHLLEPLSADSLLRWGFFNEVLSRTEYIEGYIIAPLAERMMKADPKLKAEFEAALATDPAFAQDPEARLQWFYQRSPFFDQRYLLYPIGIEK